MAVPLHTGLEHPSLLWLVATGLFAFLAGLWVNLVRGRDRPPADEGAGERE